MKKSIFLLLSLLLALAGCSSLAAEQSSPREYEHEMKQHPPAGFIPRDVKVVAAGDSLTQGVGGLEGLGGYIPRLQEKLEENRGINKAEFQNFGVKGNRTDQLLARLGQKKVKKAVREADLVIITIGGNDVMQVFKENLMGLKLKKFVAAERGYSDRLTEIFKTIRKENEEAPILLVGIYNPFVKWFSNIKEMGVIVDNWNEESEKVVSEFANASFVPVEDIFKDNEESLLYTDYFHPNSEGYDLIAERIYMRMDEEGVLRVLAE